MQGKVVIIRNAKHNPALLASKVSKGDTARITQWHNNLNTGFAFIYKLGFEMPVIGENIL